MPKDQEISELIKGQRLQERFSAEAVVVTLPDAETL